ncbi:MAG: hypothetical protein ACTSV2_07680 [Candidatus Thorarchaeota archaeon]
MNTKSLQRRLLERYYKSAQLGWFHPKTMHWTKIVSHDGYWKWIRTDGGIRGILKYKPVHIYQTLLRFKTKGPPRGKRSNGYLLGGPILFELDLFEKNEPLSLWKLIDSIPMIHELEEYMRDRENYRIQRVTYSGFRGFHVAFEKLDSACDPITLIDGQIPSRALRDFIKERKQLARFVGYHCKGWDWKVSADIWRVIRVPWSIHGSSSLRAIPLRKYHSRKFLRDQLINATPFSFSDYLQVRIKHNVPLFVFIDGEYYGPYRKGWRVKLPIAVAVHLIWLGVARPREEGPKDISRWFDRGWQLIMKKDWKQSLFECVSKKAAVK